MNKNAMYLQAVYSVASVVKVSFESENLRQGTPKVDQEKSETVQRWADAPTPVAPWAVEPARQSRPAPPAANSYAQPVAAGREAGKEYSYLSLKQWGVKPGDIVIVNNKHYGVRTGRVMAVEPINLHVMNQISAQYDYEDTGNFWQWIAGVVDLSQHEEMEQYRVKFQENLREAEDKRTIAETKALLKETYGDFADTIFESAVPEVSMLERAIRSTEDQE